MNPIRQLFISTLLFALGMSVVTTSYPAYAADPLSNPCTNIFSDESTEEANATATPEGALARYRAFSEKIEEKYGPLIRAKKFIFGHFYSQGYLIHFPYEKGLRRQVGRAFHELFGVALRFLSPIPLPFLRTPTDRIFAKQWKNPDYQPTDTERALLKKYEGEKTFDERRQFMVANRWTQLWTKFRKTTDSVKQISIAAGILLSLNHAHYAQGGMVSVDQFLGEATYQLKPGEVQLLVETTPFPHEAIRIGERVYSYGVSHMTSEPVDLYLNSKRYYEAVHAGEPPLPGPPPNPGSSGPIRDYAGASSGSVSGWAGAQLAKLPRSVQIVTLRLTPVEQNRLERDLVLATGMRYNNVTFVNDCSTMIARALQRNTSIRISPLIDASPGQVLTYFSLQKTWGDTRIGNIYQVDVDDPAMGEATLWRNAYINFLDNKVFSTFFGTNQAYRAYVDLTTREPALQGYDPEVEDAFARWRSEAAVALRSDPKIMFLGDIARSADRLTPQQREIARKNIIRQLDPMIQEAQIYAESPQTALKDILLAKYRAEGLIAKKRIFLQMLQEPKR